MSKRIAASLVTIAAVGVMAAACSSSSNSGSGSRPAPAAAEEVVGWSPEVMYGPTWEKKLRCVKILPVGMTPEWCKDSGIAQADWVVAPDNPVDDENGPGSDTLNEEASEYLADTFDWYGSDAMLAFVAAEHHNAYKSRLAKLRAAYAKLIAARADGAKCKLHVRKGGTVSSKVVACKEAKTKAKRACTVSLALDEEGYVVPVATRRPTGRPGQATGGPKATNTPKPTSTGGPKATPTGGRSSAPRATTAPGRCA